jgi:uncharacterized protein
MSWSFVSLASVASQPWRNGGGVTRELLAWPTRNEWQVRISVADVNADGPFSRFEGIERRFAVLEGEGVALSARGPAYRLTTASEPFPFDGGEPMECALLGGATRDFNLMAASGKGELRRVRGSQAVSTNAPALVAVYAHAHGARVIFGSEAIEVPTAHLAWRLQKGSPNGAVHGPDAFWAEVLR